MKFKVIKRVLINILIIITAFILQTCVLSYFSVFLAVPNLLLIVTFSMGFIYGSGTGMYCGFISGLFLDLFYNVPFGMNSLIFSYLGYFNGFFTKYCYDEFILLPVLLSVANELVYNLVLLFYRFMTLGSVDVGYAFGSIILPETLFSAMLTILLYRCILIFNQKLDRIENKRGQHVA